MKYLSLLLLIPLAACGYTVYLSDADAHGGTVNQVTEVSKDAAIEKANDHCRQYDRVAHVIQTDPQSNTLKFACVRKP